MEEKKMRTDKIKNTSKVLAEVIKDPLLTEREIAKKTGVSKSSVNRAMQEVGQIGAKNESIIKICNDDLKIVEETQKEIYRRITDETEKINMQDLIRASETSTKRYTLFKGDATDKDGGVKQPDIIFQIINPYGGEENN